MPLLGGAGLGLVVLTIVAAASLRDPKSLDVLETVPGAIASPTASSGSPGGSGSSSGPAVVAEPENELAPSAILERTIGVADLEKLADSYPKDPKVLRKLLLAYTDDPHNLPQAVPVAARVLSLDPEASRDEVVKKTIMRGASGPPSVSQVAFEAMQSGMGADGPDLLFDILTAGPSVAQAVRDRASKALADPKVRAEMSPALRIAFDLKKAGACERKGLLPVATQDGDRRSLQYLEPLVVTKGCGFLGMGDCYGCFGNRTELTKTIAAIKARP